MRVKLAVVALGSKIGLTRSVELEACTSSGEMSELEVALRHKIVVSTDHSDFCGGRFEPLRPLEVEHRITFSMRVVPYRLRSIGGQTKHGVLVLPDWMLAEVRASCA